jgi:hypothetical protein
MGIKFRCPNGHKLNVKSFLAGKKGVCPKCGTSMRIPSESTEGGESDIEETVAAVGAALPMTSAPVTGANGSAHPAPITAAPAKIPVPPAAGPVTVRPVAPVGLPVGTPAMTAAPAASKPAVALPIGAPVMPGLPGPLPPAVAVADPIAEAPAASWYVRPPSGVQYGPARGDVMQWIAEGRVSSDSLVWREGWADWKNAGQLFPNLASAAGMGATPTAAAIPSTPATRSATRYQAKKKSGSGLAVAFLVVLAVVCVALVAVLVYVLTTVK